MASRLHKGECVSRRPASFVLLLAASFSVAGGGCVYLPAINGQPDAAIEKVTTGVPRSGQPVTFTAAASVDPDGDFLTAHWRAVWCNDAAGDDCPDANEIQLGEGESFTFTPRSKQPVRLTLTVEDPRGATDVDELVLDIGNGSPVLDPQIHGHDGYPVGTWINVLDNGFDPDGDPVTYTFELFEPSGSTTAGFAPCPDIDACYRLTPDVAGLYDVRITADDGDGGVSEQTVGVLVGDDAPPCLLPDRPAGGSYPVDRDGGPWSVGAIVADDLDGTDAPPSDYYLPIGPSFSWQVASPDTGGALLPVEGLDDAAYQLDPSVFAPGDRISIRLEVADRVDRTLPCAAGDPSCSIGGDECYQRLTWEVEIR